MNESFMRKVYEEGAESAESTMQQGLNFYGQQFKNLIKTFPGTDAPIFLAAMKSVHDDILRHTATIVIPIPGGKK